MKTLQQAEVEKDIFIHKPDFKCVMHRYYCFLVTETSWSQHPLTSKFSEKENPAMHFS